MESNANLEAYVENRSAVMNRTRIRNLVTRYAGQGPRYTSYPTAVELTPSIGSGQWQEFLGSFPARTTPRELSLYVHVPFCRTLCYFCACHKVVPRNRDVVVPFISALSRNLEATRAALPGPVSTQQLHWGGGTPNYLTGRETEFIFHLIEQLFPIDFEQGDLSIELDPRTTEPEMIPLYRSLGFNRISLGVQDFNPLVQKVINRTQTLEMTADLMEAARRHAFKSINVDVLYGLPEQTLESFRETILRIIQLRPNRVALYGYAHVTWLRKTQKSFERWRLPSPETRIELFLSALEEFRDAGYQHIGLDHFALPEDSLASAANSGTLQRNFMGYTTRKASDLISFGPSAISTSSEMMVQNYRDLDQYQRESRNDFLPIERGLLKSRDDKRRAHIIEAILCAGSLDIIEWENKWEDSFYEAFQEAIPMLRQFEADGVVEMCTDSIQLTNLGRLFARNVAMSFDAYLPARLAGAKKMFSATV